MNRDDKIRDLINRLAGMSPQPPPFPEGVPMATSPPKSRPNPVLVFAAGAAIVAAVLVPLLFLDGSGPPVAGSSTTTSGPPITSTTTVTSTTIPTATSTTDATTTTTVPLATTWSGIVFLYQMPEDSFVDNPALVPVTLEVEDLSGEIASNDYFTEALAAIGAGLPELPADSSLLNAIPASVKIVDLSSVTIAGNPVWLVDMNEAFLDGAGGLLADFTLLNQLIYTITYGEGVDVGVLFTVGGEPITAFGSEGLDLSQPVYRDDFIDQLAPIFLTEPVSQVGDVYLVSGMSNVFEASLIVEVLDSDGEIVHQEPVTATCGSGCYGTFGTELDASLIVGGETSVRLLTYSAEDGSPLDVVTVPIPADGIWAMTVG